MTEVVEIQQAVRGLSESEYSRFVRWFSEYDWKRWDKQIEIDSASGDLDFIANQASESKRLGTLRDL